MTAAQKREAAQELKCVLTAQANGDFLVCKENIFPSFTWGLKTILFTYDSSAGTFS